MLVMSCCIDGWAFSSTLIRLRWNWRKHLPPNCLFLTQHSFILCSGYDIAMLCFKDVYYCLISLEKKNRNCWLRPHLLYRLGLSYTSDSTCETGIQTPVHVLKLCLLYQEVRTHLWSQGATLEDPLCGVKLDLQKTIQLIQIINMDAWGWNNGMQKKNS